MTLRVLVAGGAGFIGSQMVRALLGDELPELYASQVTVLDALTYAGRKENLADCWNDERLNFVQGSVADEQLLDRVVPGHDLVINFAAESHVDRSIVRPLAFLEANVLGAVALMDAVRRHDVGRMVQVGTDEVYGSVETGSSTEGQLLAPNSPYSASKASADLFARGYFQTFGVDIVVTRCSNNYGPYQYPEKLIPLFVTNLIEGRRLPLYGTGENVREWVHVADHCRGIAIAAVRGSAGEIYNIGGGTGLTNREITSMILDQFGVSWEDGVQLVIDRPGHDRRYSIDDSKIRGIGYVEKMPFAVGLAETIEWYRQNPAWWQPLKAAER